MLHFGEIYIGYCFSRHLMASWLLFILCFFEAGSVVTIPNENAPMTKEEKEKLENHIKEKIEKLKKDTAV